MTRILRGLKWSPKYGHHPGTLWLAAFVVSGGITGGWLGALIMLGLFGPLYLIGAWERGAEA